MQERAIRRFRILVRRDEEALRQCSALVDKNMGISSGKRWRTEEKVSILFESDLSSSILVPSSNPRTFRKYNQSRTARQCTVTRRFYRVYLSSRKRKRIEVNSESWLDSRRSQSQNRQTSCVLHCCESDGQSRWFRGNPVRLVTSKNRAIQKYLETLSGCSILVQFEARSTRRTAIFFQTGSNAVILYDTLPAEFIEKAICMKIKDQLYQRESVILRPRVVLKAYSQSGSLELPVQEARSSWDSQQDAESYGETRSNTADHRIPGKSISTVKLQDARRPNNVTKLIEMFEKHQHEEQFLEDMSQKQEINLFSEESQKLLDDMNQTEIFELYENSAKKNQYPDCNSFTEIGIICCSCGRNLK